MEDCAGPADAGVALDQAVAWRLWTRMTSREEAMPQVEFAGERPLGEYVLRMVSTIA
jgi:hypothetical protein